jgi:RNA polymerase sigma factor (sigma-70 family)
MLACAQAGCAACTEQVIRQHEPLIHVIVQDQWHWRVPYEDLVQAGRIGVWRAIQHYDASRGVPFGRYAGVAIRHHIWHATLRQQRRERLPAWRLVESDAAPGDPAQLVEAREAAALLRAMLEEACAHLPVSWERALLADGLWGRPAQSLAALGRRYGVSRERVRQWRVKALLHVRVRLLASAHLSLWGRATRGWVQRLHALNRTVMRQAGGRPKGRRRA